MYLETSVISAYFDFWKGNPQQKRETRLLWKVMPQHFQVYISDVVMVEIESANFEHLSRPRQKQKIFKFNQAHKLNTPIIIEPSELVKEL